MTSRSYNQLQKKAMVVRDGNTEVAKGRLGQIDDLAPFLMLNEHHVLPERPNTSG